MKKLNKKGFTLIELLAVIIILGVLMIIAIPSVTTYIQNSRKSAYIDSAAAYVEAVRTKVNEGKDFKLFSTDTLYLIPVGNKQYNAASGADADASSCVSVESGGQSPFSETWTYAYVGVTYNGKGYDYFFIGKDGAGQGVPFLKYKELTDDGTNKIYSDKTDRVSAGVTDTLDSQLGTLFSGKKYQSTASTSDDYKVTIADADKTYLSGVVGKTVSTYMILGTCQSVSE